MSVQRFRLFLCVLLLLLTAFPAFAEKKDGTLPEPLEQALSTLLASTPQGKPDPTSETLDTVMDFVTANTKAANRVRPAARPQGSGAYLQETFAVPLRKIISYTLNPAIPGEAIYPSSVRRNAWISGPIMKNSAELIDAAFPPAKPVFTRGVEYEETTPDTSSGCYYSYKLNRMFILTSYKGRTALFSISMMPNQSSVGKRGAIVGNDRNWTYVYTPEQGTNLPMLGWAQTYLYGSASVSVFMESAPGSQKTDMYVFKWARAGWGGSNVVKPSHITEGLKRFTDGLKQVLESPKCPPVKGVASQFSSFKAMSDADLRARLAAYSDVLAQKKDDPLDEKAFRAVLDNGAYPASLSRDDAIAELMKLYMRQQLGS